MTGKKKNTWKDHRRLFDFADFMDHVADVFEDMEDTIADMMDSGECGCGCGPQVFARVFRCCDDLETDAPRKRTQKV